MVRKDPLMDTKILFLGKHWRTSNGGRLARFDLESNSRNFLFEHRVGRITWIRFREGCLRLKCSRSSFGLVGSTLGTKLSSLKEEDDEVVRFDGWRNETRG